MHESCEKYGYRPSSFQANKSPNLNTPIASTNVLTRSPSAPLLPLAPASSGSSDEDESDDEHDSGGGACGAADEVKATGVLPDGFFDDKRKDAIAHNRKPPVEEEKDLDEIMAEFEADVEKDVEALDGYEDKLVKDAVAAREKEDKEEQDELTERCRPPGPTSHSLFSVDTHCDVHGTCPLGTPLGLLLCIVECICTPIRQWFTPPSSIFALCPFPSSYLLFSSCPLSSSPHFPSLLISLFRFLSCGRVNALKHAQAELVKKRKQEAVGSGQKAAKRRGAFMIDDDDDVDDDDDDEDDDLDWRRKVA